MHLLVICKCSICIKDLLISRLLSSSSFSFFVLFFFIVVYSNGREGSLCAILIDKKVLKVTFVKKESQSGKGTIKISSPHQRSL